MVCRMIGKTDELIIVTDNYYGAYSPKVKTVRYGKKEKLAVYAYGCMTADEEKTFRYMVERNAINYGFREFEFHYLENLNQLEDMEL